MRPAYRLFHLSRSISSRKNETEIACTLRQWYKRVMQFCRNLYTRNQRHCQSFLYASNTFEDASRGNRNHHHARRMSLTLDSSNLLSYGMTQDQFFKTHAGAEFQNG